MSGSFLTDEDRLSLLRRARDRLELAKVRLARLPQDDPEILALLATSFKRDAQVLYRTWVFVVEKQDIWEQSQNLLRKALDCYHQALKQRMSSWYLTQYLSLCEVLLVRDEERIEMWRAAGLLARLRTATGDAKNMAWSHADLAELHLLSSIITENGTAPLRDPQGAQEDAVHHARELVRLVGRDSFVAFSTRRQFRRYSEWYVPIASQLAPVIPIANAVLSELASLYSRPVPPTPGQVSEP